jgi:glycosyltransferase involved in cell wall biosynthesis
LDSINAAQRPVGWTVDVLVVANACTDDTHAVLVDYQERQTAESLLQLTWFAEAIPGKSHALNSALPKIDADLVFLEDDDQTVSDDFLVNVCAVTDQHPETSMFCGRLLPNWNGDEPSWIREDVPYRIQPCPIPNYDPGTQGHFLSEMDILPSGGNLILRPDIFKRIGSFSTELGPKGHNLAGGEDTAFIKKALSHGERLYYAPQILQLHFVDQNRLNIGFLIRFAFQRTSAVVSLDETFNRIPMYVWRKLVNHIAITLFTLNHDKRRFYLIRIAATLGEIKGFATRMFGHKASGVE